MIDRWDRARWYVRDIWQRMTLTERAIAVLLPLVMIVIGVVTFGVTPTIVHEDDVFLRIGMRQAAAKADAVEFALVAETRRTGSRTYLLPEPNHLELPDTERLDFVRTRYGASARFAWESGATALPPLANDVRIRVERHPFEEFEVSAKRQSGESWSLLLTPIEVDLRSIQSAGDQWSFSETQYLRVQPMPAGELRIVWYLLLAAALCGGIFWWVARLR